MTIYDGNKMKGTHLLSFNTQNLPSGIYLYELTSNHGKEVGKFSVAK